MKYILLLLIFAVMPVGAQVSDLIDLVIETELQGEFKSPPRDQLQKEATNQASERLVREMVGDAKFERSKIGIQNRVFRQAERYIPVIRLGEPKQTPKGYKSLVSLKVSIKDLKEVLTKEGFLYLTESLPTVLPLIEVVDRTKGTSYRWWIVDGSGGADAPVKQMGVRLIQELRKEMGSKGFYLMDPISGRYRDLMPMAYRSESFRSEELTALGEFFRASIVLRGRLAIDKDPSRGSTIRLELAGLQTENGRSVAELVRNFESRSGSADYSIQSNMSSVTQEAAKELALQLQEVWQRGTLGSTVIRVVLLGDVSAQDIDSFKREAQKITAMKRLIERRVSWEGVIFEVNISGTSELLAKKLAGLPLAKGRTELRSQTSGEIILRKVQ